ncbi:MAG: tyrosine-type recombinase/integrase [Bacteroidetes bacterium]|nr:tyrosine-type recombinase/integrase [Bacteroidota bacterium]
MRGITYHMIFAVLYCLGLRVGEAARLLVGDIDWDRHLLLIRETKFYKSRLVPFGPRLGEVLKNYVEATRVRRGILSMQDPLFSFTANRTINPCTISQAFHGLSTSPPVSTKISYFLEKGKCSTVSKFHGHWIKL